MKITGKEALALAMELLSRAHFDRYDGVDPKVLRRIADLVEWAEAPADAETSP